MICNSLNKDIKYLTWQITGLIQGLQSSGMWCHVVSYQSFVQTYLQESRFTQNTGNHLPHYMASQKIIISMSTTSIASSMGISTLTTMRNPNVNWTDIFMQQLVPLVSQNMLCHETTSSVSLCQKLLGFSLFCGFSACFIAAVWSYICQKMNR
jgi:hypothetical protein